MSFSRFSRRLAQSWALDGPVLVMVRSVDSTNSLARRVAAAHRAAGAAPPATAYVAHHQYQGRGRGDHRWLSPPGEGVYASLLLPAIDRQRLSTLPLLAGLGLMTAVRSLVPRRVKRRVALGWPNDLLVGGRKLGGVLIESMGAPDREVAVIVGFGVNCGRVPLARATSIRAERDGAIGDGGVGPEELAEIAGHLLSAVEAELERGEDVGATIRRYAAATVHRRGERLRCRTPGGLIEGRFRGFDERGFLRLETREGERSMGVGELVWAGEPT